jgi:serine/threonine-protein kinase
VENRHKLAWAYGRQALLLGRIGRPEAEEAYRGAIAVSEQLVAEFPSVVKYRGQLSNEHNNLGVFLRRQRRWTEAVMHFREAIQLDRDNALPHKNLGEIFYSQGRLDEAIGEWREVIRIETDLTEAHFHLGVALAKKGQLDEAAAEYRQAVGIKNDFAEAHYCLGLVLLDMGRPADALASLKRGHELGSRTPGWQQPSAELVRRCERLIELDSKLPAILSGQQQLADTAERIGLAVLCQLPGKKSYAAAVQLYREAFADDPKLADDIQRQHRYNAACAAALAGCGQGAGADTLSDGEKALLRRQALNWLNADLAAWAKLADKPEARPQLRQTMGHWKKDSDLAGVRDTAALAKLPEAERADWQKLWAGVGDALNRTQAPNPREEPARRP